MVKADLPKLPASKVLLGGRTLLLLPSLVGMVGLNEAIVLQQVRYRLGDDLQPRVRDGCRWARDPLERWRERDFPFWEIDTLRRAFQSLDARGLLLSAQFDRHLRDRTKWYTINFAALALREREYRAAQAGSPPPTPGRRATKRSGETLVPVDASADSAGPSSGHATTPALPPLPASDLLVDEPPLIVVVALAVVLGLDEALILQQIRYWLADERKPHVRDNRRWVCPPEVGLFDPLAFRAHKTLARGLRALERDGLLIASDRYNRLPGDRTKWYTIDFERVSALGSTHNAASPMPTPRPEPVGQNAGIQQDTIPISNRTESHNSVELDAMIQTTRIGASSGTGSLVQTAILPASLTESETEPEIRPETKQQHTAETAVVVASLDTLILATETMLSERGISKLVARRLVHHFPARIAWQVEVYDWLREHDPADERLTPGRLRRQIEEDWAAPVGYVSADERATREEVARQEAEGRAEAAVRRDAATAASVGARQALLDGIGLASADQALWARIVQAAPPLPPPFRDALFHAPREGEDAAVIFQAPVALARATGPAHVATRAYVADRIATICGRPGAMIHYLVYDEILKLLNDVVTVPSHTFRNT